MTELETEKPKLYDAVQEAELKIKAKIQAVITNHVQTCSIV